MLRDFEHGVDDTVIWATSGGARTFPADSGINPIRFGSACRGARRRTVVWAALSAQMHKFRPGKENHRWLLFSGCIYPAFRYSRVSSSRVGEPKKKTEATHGCNKSWGK